MNMKIMKIKMMKMRCEWRGVSLPTLLAVCVVCVMRRMEPVQCEELCHFGNETHQVGAAWKPQLGPPFGTLVCIHCQCLAIEKKHGVVARVKCRNFKDYCPEPACDEPVLLPGHCCKSCPGTQQAGDEWELSNMPGGLLFSGSRGRANSRTPLPLLNHHHHAAQHHHLDEPALPLRQPPTQNKAISTQDLNDIPQLPAAPSDEILPEAVGMAEKTSSSPSSGKGCTFGLEREFHQEGSEWHPYLAPFGFDRCTLCSCQNESLLVNCRRVVTCPLLHCAESEAVRDSPMDCCKRCPLTNSISFRNMEEGQLADQSASRHVTHKNGSVVLMTRNEMHRTASEVLAQGGCKLKGRVYENGAEWHPVVQPFGEMKCVLCRCKDGKKRCKRAECPQLTCAVKVQDEGECCARCATNQSEDGNKEQVNSKPEVMISTTWRGRGSRGGGRGGHKRRRAGRKNHHSKQETSSTARPLQMDGID